MVAAISTIVKAHALPATAAPPSARNDDGAVVIEAHSQCAIVLFIVKIFTQKTIWLVPFHALNYFTLVE